MTKIYGNDIMNNSQLLLSIKNNFEKNNYKLVVTEFRALPLNSLRDFFNNIEDYINFYDIILISLKEECDYKTLYKELERIIIYINSGFVLEDYSDRMCFYSLLLAEVYAAKGKLFLEYSALNSYIRRGGNDSSLLSNYKNIRNRVLKIGYWVYFAFCSFLVFEMLFLHIQRSYISTFAIAFAVLYLVLSFLFRDFQEKFVLNTVSFINIVLHPKLKSIFDISENRKSPK